MGKGFDPQKLMSFTHNEKFSFPRNAASWICLKASITCSWTANQRKIRDWKPPFQSMKIVYRMQTEAPEVSESANRRLAVRRWWRSDRVRVAC